MTPPPATGLHTSRRSLPEPPRNDVFDVQISDRRVEHVLASTVTKCFQPTSHLFLRDNPDDRCVLLQFVQPGQLQRVGSRHCHSLG